ncbi:serine/threonine-protein kinase [Buchananella felis]|uniref:serine/threonine-protein kinase n=1 Tax=Buchananella felis TaxID=3231492 RepID=UPI003527C279
MSGQRVRVVGGYQLGACLGSGGSGTVYRALAPSGQEVALKLLHPHVASDPVARERLKREAHITQLDARSIAGVLDFEIDGDEPFIVSRLVEGPTLAAFVDTHGPLGPVELANLAEDLAAGLHLVHAAGAVHRDVSPRNVIMSASGPVLIDFGIAQWVGSERVTGAGLVIGTAGYFPPEYWRGSAQEMTPAFDWWGWAGVLTFAATGRPPFGSGNPVAILERAERGQVDVAGLGHDLAELLRAALHPDPARRGQPTQTLQGLSDLADAAFAPTEVVPAGSPVETDWLVHGQAAANTEILGEWLPAQGALPTAPVPEFSADAGQTDLLSSAARGELAQEAIPTAVLGSWAGEQLHDAAPATLPQEACDLPTQVLGVGRGDDVGHYYQSENRPQFDQAARDGQTTAMPAAPGRYANAAPFPQQAQVEQPTNLPNASAYWNGQPIAPVPGALGAPPPIPTPPGFPLGVPSKSALFQAAMQLPSHATPGQYVPQPGEQLAQSVPPVHWASLAQAGQWQGTQPAAWQGPVGASTGPALAPAWVRTVFALAVGAVLAVMSLGAYAGYAAICAATLALLTAVVGESTARQQPWWRAALNVPLYLVRQAVMLAPVGAAIWLAWRAGAWLSASAHLSHVQLTALGESGAKAALVFLVWVGLWHTPLARHSRVGTAALLAELPRRAVVTLSFLLVLLAAYALTQSGTSA